MNSEYVQNTFAAISVASPIFISLERYFKNRRRQNLGIAPGFDAFGQGDSEEHGAVSVGSPSQLAAAAAAAEGAEQARALVFLHPDHSPHSSQTPPAEER